MSKRKREIQKRKKLVGEGPKDNIDPAGVPFEGDSSQDLEPTEHNLPETHTSAPHIDDSRIVNGPRSPENREPSGKGKPAAQKPAVIAEDGKGQGKEILLLALLVFYVLVLGLGTAGELFEIEWILELKIFK